MFQRCVTLPCFVSMSSSSLWPPVFDTLYLPVWFFSAMLPGPVSSRWVLHLRDHLCHAVPTCVIFQRCFTWPCFVSMSSSSSRPSVFVSHALPVWFFSAVLPGPVSSRWVRHLVTISLCHALPTCMMFQCCVIWPCSVSMSSSSSWPSAFVTLYLCDVSVLCYLALFRLDVFVVLVATCFCHTVPVWCFSAVLPGPVSSRRVRSGPVSQVCQDSGRQRCV